MMIHRLSNRKWTVPVMGSMLWFITISCVVHWDWLWGNWLICLAGFRRSLRTALMRMQVTRMSILSIGLIVTGMIIIDNRPVPIVHWNLGRCWLRHLWLAYSVDNRGLRVKRALRIRFANHLHPIRCWSVGRTMIASS